MSAPQLTYDQYLRSPWWRARRAAVIRHRGEKCERCDCRHGLQLHHRTYVRLFRERPQDVELLCEPCHLRTHGLDFVPPKPPLEPLRDSVAAAVRDLAQHAP